MTTELARKFQDPNRGVYFIGTTPPKNTINDDEQLNQIGQKLLDRLGQIEVDGLIVYDIQDESSRISKPRPFPYMETHNPLDWSKRLQTLAIKPVITYKSVSSRSTEEFNQWLDSAWDEYGIRDIVLVGAPSSDGQIVLPLAKAYETLANSQHDFNLGGVTIAERHAAKGNEHTRLINKTVAGCDFFVSQAVYNPQATVDMLSQYARTCRDNGEEPKRVILTFTPCGSVKTLEFMEWLGISVPDATKHRILDAELPLDESIKICRSALEQIIEVALPLGIPLGLNIESLTNRKEEIDASINLYKLLKATLDLKLAEQNLA
ncbi:methylenetetrahydrofolate reductase [Marinomonas gallaica]|uniref:methylenetetrahydrofolate reductase n=1 Tax=Marinomonas gallaica TaxID=1806667 RepID=UPI003A9341FA